MTIISFTSDNAVGASQEILDAIAAANHGTVRSYGEDPLTASLQKKFNDFFERKVAVFPVATGTAANCLALASVTPPHGAVYCHHQAHIGTDECGALGLFTGGAQLVLCTGDHGKICDKDLEKKLAAHGKNNVHASQPSCLSLTQTTEAGTVYTLQDLQRLTSLAHGHGLATHMDGARFANALVSLGCSPAEVTWKAGVDILSFGATKNGCLLAEAVVFFDPTLARDFIFRRKKSGHLVSKMRLISAQLDAYLTDNHWFKLARSANAMARLMADKLASVAGLKLCHPVEANILFVEMPQSFPAALRQKGFDFYQWANTIRLVTSFQTTEDEVLAFCRAVTQLAEETS